MDLDASLAFVTVVREGTFTAAGERLGLPTSTVSRQVKRLEERLGVRLLHRTTRSLSLTEVGEAYFERCSSGLDVMARAEAVALDAAAAPRGVLRFAAPPDFHRFWEAFEMDRFIDTYPEVRLDIRVEQRAVDLIAGGFDLALRAGPLPDSNFYVQKLADSALHLFASPEYIEQHGAPESPEALGDHSLCLFPVFGPRGLELSGPDGTHMVPVEPRIIVNSWYQLTNLALAGRGVALIERQFPKEHVEAGKLVRVLPDFRAGIGGFYAVYPSSQLLSPKVRVFIEHVVEAARRNLPSM